MNECKVCGVKIEKGKRLCAECEALVASLVANMKSKEDGVTWK